MSDKTKAAQPATDEAKKNVPDPDRIIFPDSDLLTKKKADESISVVDRQFIDAPLKKERNKYGKDANGEDVEEFK